MKSVVVWIRQTRKTEVELSFERDALRIYGLPSVNSAKIVPSISRQSLNASGNNIGPANPTTQNENSLNPNVLVTIPFTDIIGCHRMKGRSVDDPSSYFTVYAYPIRGRTETVIRSPNSTVFSSPVGMDIVHESNSTNSLMSRSDSLDQTKTGGNHVKKSGRRERRCFTFQVQGKYVYDDNAAYVKNWVDAIRARILGQTPPHLRFAPQIYRNIEARQRRLYVLVNPHSGPGRALEIFQDRVMPVFAEANIACRLIVTERANHAQDLVGQMNLDEWDGIVIVSGDGLVYEVINGLARRPDRERAMQMPVGVIPGGSGNALAASTCFEPRDTIKGDFAVDAAVVVVKPVYRPMRLIRVEMRGHRIWSFISVGWGLLSDIDIESERFRRTLGSARFTAGAFIRVLNLRRYRARISYVPADELRSANNASQSIILKSTTSRTRGQNGLARTTSQSGQSTARPVFDTRSYTVDEEDEERFEGLPGPVHRAKSVSPLAADRYQETFVDGSEASEYLVATTPMSNPTVQVRFDLASSNNLAKMAPSASTSSAKNISSDVEFTEQCRGDIVPMPKIDEPVPPEWKVIEDEFILFYAVYLNHIGAEAPYMPESRLDDQIIYLTFIRTSAVTRAQLVKFLFAIENAEHVNMPFFEIIPAKAFRLDRLSVGSSDIVAVDGELIKDVQGPIQACVSNYTSMIMAAK